MAFTCTTKQITQAFLPWQFAAIHGCLNFFVNYGMFSMQGEEQAWPKALILPSALFLALTNAAALRYLPIKLPNYAHHLAQRPLIVAKLRQGQRFFLLDGAVPRNLSEEQIQARADQACSHLMSTDLTPVVILRSVVLPVLSLPIFLIIAAPRLGLSLDELPLMSLIMTAGVPLFVQIAVFLMAAALGIQSLGFRFTDRELEREDHMHTYPFALGF